MNHLDVNVTLSFGGHIWRVLDRRHDAALLITETIIEQRPYHDAYVEITWADCALRRYLNGEFLDRFSAEERSRIIPVTNQNHDNQWYGTRGGEDTLDHVFLLSIEEAACKYFGDSSANLYNREKTNVIFIGSTGKTSTTASESPDARGKIGAAGGGSGHPDGLASEQHTSTATATSASRATIS